MSQEPPISLPPSQPPSAPLDRYRLFWHHKPWWCQPWSILLTGSIGIGTAGFAYGRAHAPLWLVAPVLLAILGWWFLFLVMVPLSTPGD
ncbi:MAG: DUF6737 family protein [Cyanobium sp.]